ncbi:nucleotidyltransferase family protein [Candidatus Woesearchaeota archaeon]|nr:nucleotidyltransferase family protein [Candidatus Woesearchaeota archaeon]
MDCIILAGGKGSRMEDPLPKALIQANGKPIISHQLDSLLEKVDKVVLSLGYKSGEIVEYINQKHRTSKIEFSIENEPLGTAGGLKLAMQKTSSDLVLVLNCDDLTDIDLSDLVKYKDNTVCVSHPVLPFGLVTDYCGYAEFIEKPTLKDWVSCGWYMFKKEAKDKLPDKGSLEYDVFQTGKIKLRVYHHEGFWKALNTKKDIEEFSKQA